MSSADHTYILVTGANGGLGLGICMRLIDDFVQTRSSSESLTVIFTTRSSRKGDETLANLVGYLSDKHPEKVHDRINLQAENVELTSLLGVRALAQKLLASKVPYLNAIICNAGIGGWTGIDWIGCTIDILKDIRRATTFPEFKLGAVGLLTQPQLSEDGEQPEEPLLGQVFCSNIFGHYMLAHWLMPMLWACSGATPGKVIWVGSIEARARHYNSEDHQGLRTDAAYEHGKRLTDLLALSAQGHPATERSVENFFDPSQPLVASKRSQYARPTMHVTHPGILATTIIALYWIVQQAYLLGVLVTRLCGGVWSTVNPYPAAMSATFIALVSTEGLKAKEAEDGGGQGKWGTAITRLGTTSVKRTVVDGWGTNGSGAPHNATWWGGKSWLGGGYIGMPASAREETKESVEDFIAKGAEGWRKMEEMRADWEKRLKAFDKQQEAAQ